MIRLTELPNSKEGVVVDLDAGLGLKRRLYAMDIIPGKKIKKKLGFEKGPIVVQVDDATYSLGYGVASKIIVDYDEKLDE